MHSVHAVPTHVTCPSLQQFELPPIQLCSHWSEPLCCFFLPPSIFFSIILFSKPWWWGTCETLSLEVPAFYFWFPFQRVACHIKRGNNKISSNNENQLVSLLSSFPFLPITNSSIQHSTARAGNNITTNKKRLKYNRFSFSFFQNLSSIVSNHGLIRITSSPDFSYHWQLFF